MLFTLGKTLQTLFWPYNQALIWLAVIVALLWRGKVRMARNIASVLLVFLYVLSSPWVALRLFLPLESEYLPQTYESYPQADAIVVLGGTVSSHTPPRIEVEETHGSRLVPALRLWRLKKAPVILLSSGSWYKTTEGKIRVEANDMREFLLGLGVPDAALWEETRSRNTYENAAESSFLLKSRGMKSILLVTSAFHMRRALPHFLAEGLQVTPVPTEHRLIDRPFSVWDFVPDLTSLGMTTSALKERIGLFFYDFVLKWKKRDHQ